MTFQGQDGDKDNIEVDDEYSTGCAQTQMREAISCPFLMPTQSSPLMLSISLGGNFKTSVIVCTFEDVYQVSQTNAAIKFGQSNVVLRMKFK